MADENCAVDAQGKLKDAEDITWYQSGDDDTPILPAKAKSKPGNRVPVAGPSSTSTC